MFFRWTSVRNLTGLTSISEQALKTEYQNVKQLPGDLTCKSSYVNLKNF